MPHSVSSLLVSPETGITGQELDTNSVHYVDLFMHFARRNGFTADDIDEARLTQRLQHQHDRYREGIQKGHKNVSFVLREDAQIEFSQVTKIELLCGRVKGSVIESAAKEGVPDRMWSRIDEKYIRDQSREEDLRRIRMRVGDFHSVVAEWGVIVASSEEQRPLDVFELAMSIVGFVYMSVTDSIVYASAIAARADILVTGDGYLYHTVNLIHNPSDRPRYQNIKQNLERLGDGPLPIARSCDRL